MKTITAIIVTSLFVLAYFHNAPITRAQAQTASTVTSTTTALSPTIACHTFARNIGIGARGFEGSDLAFLRLALEKEGFSLGKYADIVSYEAYKEYVFGRLTFSAVKDFQEKYTSDILKQYGLKKGTGFVGVATRAKLNQLYGCKIKIAQMPVTASSTTATSSAYVYYPSYGGGGGGGGGSSSSGNSTSNSNTASVITATQPEKKPEPPVPLPRSIKVVDPTNSLIAPTTNPILWESQGVSKVKIEACWNNNTECTVIADSVDIATSPQTYVWNVEVDKPYSGKNDVTIKISDIDFSTFDFQDHGIKVVSESATLPRILTVTAPVNSFIVPTTIGIKWEYQNISKVKIEACWNSKTECSLVATDVDASLGQYAWNAEDNKPYVGKDDVVIKISDLDSIVYDYLDSPIKIIPLSLAP